MMKFKNHIFFMLGLASVFSMTTFDAMAKACNKKDVAAGKWCIEGGSEQNCRAGCYCEGANKKKGISLWVDVAKFCREGTEPEKYAEQGVHKCPTGKTSNTEAKTINDCYDVQTSSSGDDNCKYAPDIGRYCKHKNSQPLCEPGCYCPGGNTSAVGSNDSYERQVRSRCSDHGTANGAKEYLAARGVFYCPEDFPDSDSGMSKIDRCYFKDGGKKVKYSDPAISVPAGNYLPKQKKDYTACPADKYCPGGSFKPSAAKAVGVYDCSGTGAVISNNKASCVITCSPGTYYESSSESCKSCQNSQNKYCPDTTTVVLDGGANPTSDLGLKNCPSNQHPSNDYKSCEPNQNDDTSDTDGNNGGGTGNSGSGANDVVADITIDAGYYLPAGKTKHSEQKLCYGTTNFCPGGVFSSQDFDQGIYECPGNGRAANDKKSCNISLSKEELKSGFARVSDCWLLTDRNDFMECVFGGELYNVSNGSSNGGTAYIEKTVADYQNKTVLSDAVMQVEKGKKDNDDKLLKVNNNTRYDISAGADVTQMKKPDFVSKEPITQKKITTSQSGNATTTTASKVDSTAASFKSVRSVRKR